jgi:hypothetical protein
MPQSHHANRDAAVSTQTYEILSESVESVGESWIQERGDGEYYPIVRNLQQSASKQVSPKSVLLNH